MNLLSGSSFVPLLTKLTRSYPEMPGLWRVRHRVMAEVRRRGRSLGCRTVTTQYGFRMELRLNDWVDQHIYVTGAYEEYSSIVVAALVNEGATVVDVGANIGYFSLLAGQCVGDTGQVFAMEPVTGTYARLERNCRLNDHLRVHPRRLAISDAPGTVDMWVASEHHTGQSSLRPLGGETVCQSAPAETLDRLLAGQEDQVSLVKIDVEGAECRVLRGMTRILDQSHPDAHVEVTDSMLREMGDSGEKLCSFFLDRGYRMYYVDEDGLIPLEGFRQDLPPQFNALFSCRDRFPEEIRVKPAETGIRRSHP